MEDDDAHFEMELDDEVPGAAPEALVNNRFCEALSVPKRRRKNSSVNEGCMRY